MKGLTGLIAAIFLISLSAGLMYYHCNATKMDEPNEVPDSTMTFEPADTTAPSEEGRRIIGLSSPEFKRVGEQAMASSMNLEQNVRY